MGPIFQPFPTPIAPSSPSSSPSFDSLRPWLLASCCPELPGTSLATKWGVACLKMDRKMKRNDDVGDLVICILASEGGLNGGKRGFNQQISSLKPLFQRLGLKFIQKHRNPLKPWLYSLHQPADGSCGSKLWLSSKSLWVGLSTAKSEKIWQCETEI